MDVLVDAVNLPAWNPAFESVLPRHWIAGEDTYAIRTTGGMRGTLSYDTAGAPDVVRISWRVPGLAETGAWLLEPRGRSTLVTHEFVRSGALARVLAPVAPGVAALRLARLEDRLENLAHWSGRRRRA